MKNNIFKHALQIRELAIVYENLGINIYDVSPTQIIKDAKERYDVLLDWDEYDSDARRTAGQLTRLRNFLNKWEKEVKNGNC
ncbi:MAG: hypothetical protein IJ301_02165 [Clostridia bacterium]|nr:hypothetical protein [Clostridia bacterium]